MKRGVEVWSDHLEGGGKERVNVAMDSYTAIIKDVLKAI